MFGTFIKELRAKQRLGLREFCLEHGHDPSNWSKIEREVLQPPRDEETLRTWAKQLGHSDIVGLLTANLEEENAANSKLTALANSNVNMTAVAASAKSSA